MSNGIHESLIELAVDIDVLSPLDGNPRRGNVEAIMASYREFGQIKPIVIRGARIHRAGTSWGSDTGVV